ncbi:hypothetical protein HF329_00855 [Chitinophaga oryzae]|uniref:Bacteriophage Mx8 p63 C-terminal domain-containing protein n=1 Tax=Chitinophaga oryzae TaxID=2725414 RepID=A0AAE6ZBU2_9BACT|nr:P63C domain-containing protein [Chitinophaga oryzae]QJB29933.1 hypothetical protein HF329_00855 [Chitinophaga oryzae]
MSKEKGLKGSSVEENLKKSSLTEKEISKISEEAIQERNLLSDLLVRGADELVKEALQRKKKREEEEIELRSGVKISIKQINDFVTANRQPYTPMFPNSVPFFVEMYRLLGWHDKNPHEYTKPAIVGDYINQLIYDRFNRDVRPALQVLAMPGGVRLHKFFQFLTPEGQKKLEMFRDEAIGLMKECATWHEFRVKYGKKYGLPVQERMFEDKENA